MKKALIFDMDGLMIDSERVTWEGYEKHCRLRGYTMTYGFYLSMVGNPMPVIRKLLREQFGPEFPTEEIICAVHEDMDWQFSGQGVPKKRGLDEILSHAKDAGLQMLVATSSDRSRVEKILKYADIDRYFADIICGDEVTNGKPAPDIFLRGCEKLGIRPGEAFVLEDSQLGVLAAHRAGIDVICVPDLKQPEDEYRRLAFAMADSLFEAWEIIKRELEK